MPGSRSISATLTAPSSVTLGGFLEADGLTVTATDLDYQTDPPAGEQAFGGTIGISATSVALFPGSSAFTTTVTGFQGSYDLNSGALGLSASEVDIQVGSVLDVTADTVGFALEPTSSGVDVNITVGSATVSLPQFDVSGSITDLAITNDGFSLGSLTLSVTKTISYGSIFSIENPKVTVTSFGYSISSGASFNGSDYRFRHGDRLEPGGLMECIGHGDHRDDRLPGRRRGRFHLQRHHGQCAARVVPDASRIGHFF